MTQEEWTLTLGHALRRARIAKGMTQGEVGQKLGLSRTSILNIEQGRQQISAYKLFLLNSLLNAGFEQTQAVKNCGDYLQAQDMADLRATRKLLSRLGPVQLNENPLSADEKV